ncbi:MAG: Lrp/AsnC family transcriptional regulator [Burkholderiaceae bacterium]|nr:Lrp/AsnC family transcriptional regulator [Burkholderiaceae bacterium]
MTDSTIQPFRRERPLDEFDLAILAALRAAPRETSKAIAEQLSVSEATVAARIRALEGDRVIKVMAQSDFRAAGYQILASVDLHTGGRSVQEVAQELAALEQVALVSILMGDPSISLMVMAASLEDLQRLTTSTIAGMRGVRAVETTIFSEIIKYRSELGAL